MHAFTYHCPTEIVFGKDTQLQLAEQIRKYGGSRALLVYGSGSIERSGLLSQLCELLSENQIPYELFGGVRANPTLEHAREGVKLALKSGADFVIGAGGGSVIDTAKAIAIGAANAPTDIWEFWTREKTPHRALPVGAVLTISAAGSESSDSSVLTNLATGEKRGLGTELIRPRFAIMNPELAATLPKYQIACGVTDIMMHTMERYFIPESQCEMTDEIAEGLLRTVIKNGPKVLENPSDYNAMAEIMWCGSLSHNGLTECGRGKDFSVHKFGHALSAKYDVAHGASLAAVWGAWAKYQYDEETVLWRFARFAEKVWGITEGSDHKRATEGIERTVAFFHSLGMPTSLHELDILNPSDEDLRALSMDATQQDTVKLSRIRKLGAQEVYEIYQMAR